MNDKNDKKQSKLIFFDVDGTLSAPCFPVNGTFGPGMPTEEWLRYCVAYGPDAYQWCRPVPQVFAYARRAKENGAKLYVLTTSQTVYETEAKKNFIRRCDPSLFEEVIAVAADPIKQVVIEAVAGREGVSLEECELVEDTYMTLLEAAKLGIRATHISNILTEED